MLSNEELFSVLKSLPLKFLLLFPDKPKFTVLVAKGYFPERTGAQCPGMDGKALFDFLYNGQEDEQEIQSRTVLKCSLDFVLQMRREHKSTLSGYPEERHGRQAGWWTVEHIPLFDDDGNIRFILHVPSRVVRRRGPAVRIKGIGNEAALLNDVRWMNSHEIRRPLANILGALELINGCRKEGEKIPQEYFDLLHISATQLDLMVRGVIDMINGMQKRS